MPIKINVEGEVPEEVASFIGEGKKYRDFGTALEAVPHQVLHIQRLEAELAEMRAQNKNTDELEAKLKTLEEKLTTPPKTEPKTESAQLTPDDLRNQIAEGIKQEKERAEKEANVNLVKGVISKINPNVEEYISNKAKELGVQADYLKGLAATSPNAFLKLADIPASSIPSTATPKGSQIDINRSPSGIDDTDPMNYSYYKKLFATDKKKYYSTEVQGKMMNAALEAAKKGVDFYKT